MITNDTEKNELIDNLIAKEVGTWLTINDQQLSKEDIIYLFQQLKQKRQITHLELSRNGLNDELMTVFLA